MNPINRIPIIEVTGVSKSFPGVKALDNVNLEVFPGEIHAIIGENGAGKSTLMNILVGQLQPDQGSVKLNGKPIKIGNPAEALKMGIAIVSQELALCPNLTLSENISLWKANQSSNLKTVPRRSYRQIARRLLLELGLPQIDVDSLASQTSVAKQQLVEIAKAISTEAKVLILDEPNSALTKEETQHIFEVIRKLKNDNVAILYISHHLDEIMEISDTITILRDGQLIDNIRKEDATIDLLINRMVGRSITNTRANLKHPKEETLIEVQNLSAHGEISDISFKVKKGEIVGIAGLPDSKKDELGLFLFGMKSFDKGKIKINGKEKTIRSPHDAINQGMILLPADRRAEGALLLMSVQENIMVSSLQNLSKKGVILSKKSSLFAHDYRKKLDVRAQLTQRMANLSGGNQQKAILARGLGTSPDFLVVNEPTRGIDIGAKAEIYQILHQLAEDGVGMLIVSSELPELMANCHRILVMFEGKITGEFDQESFDQEKIMACATGQVEQIMEGSEIR